MDAIHDEGTVWSNEFNLRSHVYEKRFVRVRTRVWATDTSGIFHTEIFEFVHEKRYHVRGEYG